MAVRKKRGSVNALTEAGRRHASFIVKQQGVPAGRRKRYFVKHPHPKLNPDSSFTRTYLPQVAHLRQGLRLAAGTSSLTSFRLLTGARLASSCSFCLEIPGLSRTNIQHSTGDTTSEMRFYEVSLHTQVKQVYTCGIYTKQLTFTIDSCNWVL